MMRTQLCCVNLDVYIETLAVLSNRGWLSSTPSPLHPHPSKCPNQETRWIFLYPRHWQQLMKTSTKICHYIHSFHTWWRLNASIFHRDVPPDGRRKFYSETEGYREAIYMTMASLFLSLHFMLGSFFLILWQRWKKKSIVKTALF